MAIAVWKTRDELKLCKKLKGKRKDRWEGYKEAFPGRVNWDKIDRREIFSYIEKEMK